MRPLRSLLLSLAIIILAVPPWIGFEGHTHWDRVGWIPFVSPPIRLRDIIANLLLFAPLGATLARNFPTRPVITVAVTSLLISVAGEWTQIYSHIRFPSATDVVCNVIGAVAAAHLVKRWMLAISRESVTE